MAFINRLVKRKGREKMLVCIFSGISSLIYWAGVGGGESQPPVTSSKQQSTFFKYFLKSHGIM